MEDVTLFLPKFHEYRFNDKLRAQFASFIDLKSENNEFSHEQKLQEVRLPDEICILKDFERIRSVLLSKSEMEMHRD